MTAVISADAAAELAARLDLAVDPAGISPPASRRGGCVTVQAIVRRLAADLWRSSQGNLFEWRFEPWPPSE